MSNSTNNYYKFLSEVAESNESLIFYAIPRDSYSHPCETECSVFFIYGMKNKKTTYVSFTHQDASHFITKEQLIFDLLSLKNKKWVFDKKECLQMIPLSDLNDIDLYLHLWMNEITNKEKYETVVHKFIKRKKRGLKNLNDVIPLLKHKEMFETMCENFSEMFDIDDGYKKENSIVIETLAELESNGIYVNKTCFGQFFKAVIPNDNLVHSQYHIYTSTGRPSNNFAEVNYAALNIENGCRNCFVSRYDTDGKMILIDYSAFHPRIICNLIKFPLDINIDIYKYLGELYFNRDMVNDFDIAESKKLTFKQLYGGVEEKFEHIKYFARIKSFIETNWQNFIHDGFILTPLFKRRITKEHIKDANPNKLFNYILQATETEVAIPAINEVNKYLRDKKTKAVLYTYDSILFDFHKDDGGKILNDVITIMKMNDSFPVKVYMGDSYAKMNQIYP